MHGQQVLAQQLEVGLSGADRHRVAIAYEPVWSIGPGKTPADQAYITKVARFVKAHTGGLPVVYGGGLKQDNAAMLARIPEIDGVHSEAAILVSFERKLVVICGSQ